MPGCAAVPFAGVGCNGEIAKETKSLYHSMDTSQMGQNVHDTLNTIKEFSALINTALLLSLLALGIRLFRSALSAKDAHLELLKERLAAAEDFSIERVRDRFKALREWYELSVSELQRQLDAVPDGSPQVLSIRSEAESRATLLSELSAELEDSAPMEKLSPELVCGKYSVVGRNPSRPSHGYMGTLQVVQEGDRLRGVWEIGPNRQRHEGVGLLHDNSLAFVFRYRNRSAVCNAMQSRGMLK